MRDTLEDALQQLLSPRSSSETRTKALNTLERLFAAVAIPNDSGRNFLDFLALQDTFECNISSHLLAWLATSTTRLENLTNKGSLDNERESEATVLSVQVSTALSILQGLVLNHGPSKRYLGRKYALEAIVELLLVSRHVSSLPLSTTTNKTSNSTGRQVDMTSVVLDTLLCVLVDSSCALRCFEEVNGVQAVVKILKRAGTPRQVRMKCLEFLYFYLLDETSPSTSIPDPISLPTRTAPATPERVVDATDTSSLASWPSSSFSTSKSSSWGSISSTAAPAASIYDTMTTATTCNTSVSPSPPPGETTAEWNRSAEASGVRLRGTRAEADGVQARSRSLMMLKKEVEFVPISPIKTSGNTRLGPNSRSFIGKSPMSRSKLGISDSDGEERHSRYGRNKGQRSSGSDVTIGGGGMRRTTEEKMDLLGGMLGNVEALVEGVRKAGVWGLG